MNNRVRVKQSTAGFTLIELIVALVIIGVLASIAAPSWLTFMNNRRASIANDQILQTLRQAQAQAIRTKQVQTVQFDVNAAPPTITASGATQTLGNGQFQANSVGVKFTNSTTSPTGCSDTNCIAFDASGNVQNLSTATNDQGIRIMVMVPRSATTPSRCVIVQTLLGAMQTQSGTACN